jgi:serine/threonine protein kinase/Tfp pilus assembly protein PilF
MTPMAEKSCSTESDRRAEQVREVVRGYLRERRTGSAPHENELIARHPELAPELAQELCKLRLIDQSRKQAETTAGPSDPSPPTAAHREAPDTQAIAHAIAGYEIIRQVHRGGQGVVYEAVQQATHRRVAIKVMREGMMTGPNDRVRFQREVQVLGALSHPHIVTIHDSGTVAGRFYFVMDFIDGRPLDVFLAGERSSVNDTFRLFAKICDAVQSAHLRGVIHRDLKPGNLLINLSGDPYILDFGLAKLAHNNEVAHPNSKTVTEPGQFVGSLPWASPEQVDGAGHRIDLRTDVYSLGVMLYQLLTRQFPYPIVGRMADVMRNILDMEPTRPSRLRREINDEVETIVLKCLQKEPDRRYQSAGELAGDIGRYLSGLPIEAKRDSTWYVIKKTALRYKVPVGFGVFLVLLSFAFGLAMSAMYGRVSQEAGENRALAAAMTELIQFGPAEMSGGQIYVRDLLDRNAAKGYAELQNQPEALAQFLQTIVNMYLGFEAGDPAIPWARKLLDLHRDVLGSDPAAVAQASRTLARALVHSDHHEQAEFVFQEALDTTRRTTNGPNPELTDLLIAFGGYLGYRKGEYVRGRAMLEEALGIHGALHAGDHPSVATALFQMAAYLHDMAAFPEAEVHYRLSLEMHQRLGLDPWGVKLWLWLFYKDTERYKAALPLIQEALDNSRTQFGDESLPTATAYSGLAKYHRDAGDLASAHDVCRKTLDLHANFYGESHEATAATRTLLGWILYEQGRYAEAEPLLRRSLEVQRKRLPKTNWETAKTESLLGAALAGLGQFEEAETLLLESFPVIYHGRGAKHRRTQEAVDRIVFLYERRSSSNR